MASYLPIINNIQHIQELTTEQVAAAKERAKKFELLAWKLHEELHATHILNYLKVWHLIYTIDELMN